MTYTEALQAQCDLMLGAARRLDERGYTVLFGGLNRLGDNNLWPYSYFNGALSRWVDDWAEAQHRGESRRIGENDTRRRPVIVHIFADQKHIGKPLDGAFLFSCEIPNRVRYRPIHAALGLMARRHDRGNIQRGSGPLRADVVANNTKYRGKGKTELQILLAVLNMPHHRRILKGC